MSQLVQDKKSPIEPSRKKTKSRNGCARCKLKKLKCDETAPSCMQCRKRNATCPGYERTLKWSTKYEVLQPPRGAYSYANSDATFGRDVSAENTALPPDIESGFEEALAAFLPETDTTNELLPEYVLESPMLPAEEDGSQQTDTSCVYDATTTSDQVIVESLERISPNLSFDLDPEFEFAESSFSDNTELLIEDDMQYLEAAISPWATGHQQSHSLLLDYYRLSNPSPASTLDDIESILIQHYFKDVCVLFSSFDSILNPFRTTIGRIFQDSSSIYFAIQSMAAAHLANTFPSMAAVGIELQHKACSSLQKELALVQSGQIPTTVSFLSIILLGLTTCWHKSNALGEQFLATARSLILPKLLCNSEREEVQRETQFFEESLIYWEMHMGFVSHDPLTTSTASVPRNRPSARRNAPAARNKDGKIVPHPWTGIAPTIQLLFAEVGRLVRRQRLLHMSGILDESQHRDNLANAKTLEEDLLTATYPPLDDLADPGDSRTAKRDFVVMAETYRYLGLLQLYRVFPSLLRTRLAANGDDDDANLYCTSKLDLGFPPPRFDTVYESTDTKLWTTSLALHIIDGLASLPSSSGTCFMQPLLLVAAASELHVAAAIDYFDLYASVARVRAAREFAMGRLTEYAQRLPGKPIRMGIRLLREVWRRGDGGAEVFWMDVMVQMGWGTVMG